MLFLLLACARSLTIAMILKCSVLSLLISHINFIYYYNGQLFLAGFYVYSLPDHAVVVAGSVVGGEARIKV